VRVLNDIAPRPAAEYVLYWMTAARRTRWNYALQRACEYGRTLRLPVLVLEALRVDYPWASERFHRFVIDGMADNRARFEAHGVFYHPYVEPRAGDGQGLLEALATHAVVVVTDDYPAFFLPSMLRAAAERIRVRFEAVDSNGLLPMRAADGTFATAYAFRRHLQRTLPAHLSHLPLPDPLAVHSAGAPSLSAAIPSSVLARWPPADLTRRDSTIAALDIDRAVGPTDLPGGPDAASARLAGFVERRLAEYARDRNHPALDATSGLSPYLHFGHVSAHEIFHRVAMREGWDPTRIHPEAKGRRVGWWGMSEDAEAFLDQVVTWRELGFNRCQRVDRYDAYEALPPWARKTLREHAADPREWTYDRRALEEARTHDPLWNAAQNQLRREGRIHNYLRMLWGKKILEWSDRPRTALDTMIALNDKYALDGRDPNSYTGILWILGLHDRAWGPERQIFGKIRYMSSANTARKLRLGSYVEDYRSP